MRGLRQHGCLCFAYHRGVAITSARLDAEVNEVAALDAATCLFRGFSDRSRLAIVQHLLAGEHRVVDLTRHLDLAQSTVSKHLACLVDCSVVAVRPQGRASLYSLTHPEQTLALLRAAEVLLAATGDAVTLCRTYGSAANLTTTDA
jgi:DNA-binding transcriptional ArsR family regulator